LRRRNIDDRQIACRGVERRDNLDRLSGHDVRSSA
jgi:hypothetical protein